MTWGGHFATGIEEIDAQHRRLVDLINAAAPLLAAAGEAPAREVQPLLDSLAEYAANHFRAEEVMMAERGIDPGYRSYHHGNHAAFSRQVEQMRREALANDNVSGNDLLRFLTNWLSLHILAEDRQVARQLRAIKAGASPAQAYRALDQADDNPVLAVLTDATVDMFSLLTRRNEELLSLNEELQAAKAALTAANRQLEARVAERLRRPVVPGA